MSSLLTDGWLWGKLTLRASQHLDACKEVWRFPQWTVLSLHPPLASVSSGNTPPESRPVTVTQTRWHRQQLWPRQANHWQTLCCMKRFNPICRSSSYAYLMRTKWTHSLHFLFKRGESARERRIPLYKSDHQSMCKTRVCSRLWQRHLISRSKIHPLLLKGIHSWPCIIITTDNLWHHIL